MNVCLPPSEPNSLYSPSYPWCLAQRPVLSRLSIRVCSYPNAWAVCGDSSRTVARLHELSSFLSQREPEGEASSQDILPLWIWCGQRNPVCVLGPELLCLFRFLFEILPIATKPDFHCSLSPKALTAEAKSIALVGLWPLKSYVEEGGSVQPPKTVAQLLCLT